MLQPKQLFPIVCILLFFSCNIENKYPYAIKDFRKELQPHLITIVTKGIVTYCDSNVSKMPTDKELMQLIQSEHPILRGWAFWEISQRKSLNHLDILMNHLDDTAKVGYDHGEFGIVYMTISDDILQQFEWKSIEEKNNAIDQVITKHNYLSSAYSILSKIEPQEKYYAYIKDMATRKRNYDEDVGEKGFGDIEYALYGLAKFRKKEDVKIIKGLLLKNNWRMNYISFKLMSEFPDTAYMDVYEKYYPNNYYNSMCKDRSIDKPVGFINSIASYKNDRSSKILGAILNQKSFPNCGAVSPYIREELLRAILNNPCDAYSSLNNWIKRNEQDYKKITEQVPYMMPIDITGAMLPKEVRYW